MIKSKIIKTDAEWKSQLSEEAYVVCRQKGTEAPFSGKYYKYRENAIYSCICCDNELFSSDHKYDSGSGWPSFFKVIGNEAIEEQEDNSYNMKRTEIICQKCSAHLGHVFQDGPEPTGLRYCVSSVALNFSYKKFTNKLIR